MARWKVKYGETICKICGMWISTNGLAQASHYKKHQREMKKSAEKLKENNNGNNNKN